MSLSAMTAGPDLLPSSRRSGRPESGGGLYRLVAFATIFAMLFGGLLLMPLPATAATYSATPGAEGSSQAPPMLSRHGSPVAVFITASSGRAVAVVLSFMTTIRAIV